MSRMDYVGLPVRESVPLVVDLLDKHGLRDRFKVISSGKLINPTEIASITRSRGLSEPWWLQQLHRRIAQDDRRSMSLNEPYPGLT